MRPPFVAQSVLVQAVCFLVTLAVAVSAAQTVSRPESLHAYARNGGGYPAFRYRYARFAKIIRPVFGFQPMLLCGVFRTVLGIACLVTILAGEPWRWPLALLALFSITWMVQAGDIADGSDRFSLLCLLPLAIGAWIGTAHATAMVLLFIAAQAALVYGIAGFTKLMKKSWWNGNAVTLVAASADYGDETFHSLLRTHPKLSSFVGIATAMLECALSVAAFLPPGICLLTLAAGVLLHLAIARVLGLNLYLPAFCATYPAT